MSASRQGSSNKNPNIQVTVRIRPPSEFERGNIDSGVAVKCMDERVVVFDPADLNKPQAGRGPQGVRRGKDIPFAFDRVFDQYATQYEVFQHTTQTLVTEVLNGYNCACFAYGATGAGKTFTMVGTESAPGVMVLTLQELFGAMKANAEEKKYSVKISYLEVYNENIHDLLVPISKPLQLLESGDKMTVLGLTTHEPKSAEEILEILMEGNKRRAQNFTHANAESSRSHAVLQVMVEQRDRTANVTTGVRSAKFSLIDLAGSERASRTKNMGKQLVEGANINRSLLALGNCINALGNGYTEGKYVPYRDSKLTRLLKDSLGGNCKTVMISNVSPSTLSYEDTFNTLQYANRAKNIKTKVRANEINVVSHVTEYKSIIADLRKEVEEWKLKCSQFEGQLEEEGRQRQIEMDENVVGLSPSMLRSRPNSQAGAPNSAQMPLLSRTVSMGLQTPRNSKVEKKVITWASEIADLALDRRNVQSHLEEANLTIAELTESKARLQEAMMLKKDLDGLQLSSESSEAPEEAQEYGDLPDLDAAMVTPMKRSSSKRNLESVILAKREYDLVSRKLEENRAERNILLQRLGRNAESSKRIQAEMSQITPRAEDASLFHQLKLELVINVLEISNFNRSMQESQLSHALAVASDKYSRTLELADYLRSALTDYDYEETMDVACKFDMAHAPTDEPLECAHLPSPFAQSLGSAAQNSMRSPTAAYATGNSSMFGTGEEPSTPSRFDLGAADSDSIASSHTARSAMNGSRSGMGSVRFHGISESANETLVVSSPMAARRPPTRVPLATTTATSKAPSATQANAANRVTATSKFTATKTRTAYNAVAPVRATGTTVGTTSAKKTSTATSVTARARQSMIPTAPASTTKERVRSNTPTGSSTTASSAAVAASAKRTSAMGGAQRVSAVSHFSRAAGASARPAPVATGSNDAKKSAMELAGRYKNDPTVVKALASFKPAFEPQERSTPPSSAAVSALTAGASRHVKVSSTGSIPSIRSGADAVSPSTPSTPRAHPRSHVSYTSATDSANNATASDAASPQNSIGVFRVEPSNPLAVLLQSNSSGSANSLATTASSGDLPTTPLSSYSRPPTVGMVYSPSSPSQSISTSPLFTVSSGNIVHTHNRSNSGPASPMSPIAKPLRV